MKLFTQNTFVLSLALLIVLGLFNIYPANNLSDNLITGKSTQALETDLNKTQIKDQTNTFNQTQQTNKTDQNNSEENTTQEINHTRSSNVTNSTDSSINQSEIDENDGSDPSENSESVRKLDFNYSSQQITTVTFNGSLSTDRQDIQKYIWNFGDKTTDRGKVVQHSYTPGTYNVTLTVVDPENKTDKSSMTVKIG